MLEQEYSAVSDQLRAILETTANEAGRASGFVQRESKLSASCFAQAMVFGSLERPAVTLRDFTQSCADLGVAVSNSGFNQRLDEEAVVFMKALLEQCLQLHQPIQVAPPLLARFNAVHILDSSYIALPPALAEAFAGLGSASAAGAKLMLNYEYLRGTISALQLLPGRTPDQCSRLHVEWAQPGSLTLFDLGFFKQEVFADIAAQGAYFLSRYHLQTALYTTEGQRFDLSACLRQSSSDQLSLTLLLGEKARCAVRVVCQRLPDVAAAERRRKARLRARQDGRRKQPPSPQTLFLLGWTIFITNVPAAWLTVDQLQLLYRVRWQIELLFKLWKSRAQLDQIGPFRPARVLCQFYARLIGILLFHWLVAPTYVHQPQLSLAKAFTILQHHVTRLLIAIAVGWHGLTYVLQRIEADWLRLARKDKRRKVPSTYTRLLQAGL